MLLVAHRTPATRAGCELLARAGAGVFEADVQLGAHGRIVVSHYLPFGAALQRDNWRLRLRSGAVRDPLLDQVVSLVPEGCLVSLDMKDRPPERRARLIAALIDQLPDRERYRVCSGGARDLATLRQAGFRTWRSIGTPRDLAAVLAETRLEDDAVSIRHTLVTRTTVEALHERVPTIVAWTVNSLARARRLRALGVDGITTDRIGVMLAMAAGPSANTH